MDNTPNLSLPYIAAAQAQKHVTHNEAIRALDAVVQLSVLDRDLAAPPVSPADGERYIVAAPATGDWAGKEGQIAAWQDNAWMFYVPNKGWLVWVADENALLAWDGTAWVAASGTGTISSLNPADGGLVGVNATADATNRLSVKSDAVLFSHDDVTPGSGDMRAKLNKAAVGNTATFLFQDNWSGRAEIGLAGDDDFHFKVSPDNTTWYEAIIIDRNTGKVRFPSGGIREVLQANRTYYVNAATGNDSNDGLTAGTAFKTIQAAVNACWKIDSNGYNVTIQLADGTYTAFLVDRQIVGGARLDIRGNAAAPQNVVIQAATYHTTRWLGGSKSALRHVQLEAANTWSLINVQEASDLYIDNLIFTGISSRDHMEVSDNSAVTVAGNYQITGGAKDHLNFAKGSQFNASGKTATLTGTPNFTRSFAYFTHGANYYVWNMTWSGAATGKRYEVLYNATCNGGSATHFPGDAAGTTANGGQYGW